MKAPFREVWRSLWRHRELCVACDGSPTWGGPRYLDIVEPCINGYDALAASLRMNTLVWFVGCRQLPKNYYVDADKLFEMWWFRASPADEEGEDVLLWTLSRTPSRFALGMYLRGTR